ncbi:hypothetical protein M8J75_004499 [Diaphorina citri]|nr:hypothetical protein M8J75_004499 [Diaphorina citri]
MQEKSLLGYSGSTLTYPFISWPHSLDNDDQELCSTMYDCTSTKLSHATNNLDESIETFLRDPIVPLNVQFQLDRESATFGILQELAEICWFSKKKLKDMYGAVRLDDEAHIILSKPIPPSKSRDIGLTEIKALDLVHVYVYLCSFIVYTCSFNVGPHENFDVTMWIMVTPPNELPWYGIIKQLYMCNRLPSFVRLVQEDTQIPAPPCYTYEASASQYIGVAIWSSIRSHMQVPRLTILSYYREGELLNHIEIFITNMYWKTLMTTVGRIYTVRTTGLMDHVETKKSDDASWTAAFIIACSFKSYDDIFTFEPPDDFDIIGCAENHFDGNTMEYYSTIYGRFMSLCEKKDKNMETIYIIVP